MAGELFQAAGQNFKQAGDTAIASGEAQTQKEQVEQQPGTQAGKNITDLVQTAMGDKARMKEIQEQSAQNIKMELLKSKMGQTKFPPGMAAYMAKRFKEPDFIKMADQPMSNDVLAGFIAHAFNKDMQKPKEITIPVGDKNVPGTLSFDDDGNPKFTPLSEGGPRFNPNTGKGSASSESKETDKWFERADKARKQIQDTFTKKGGMPKTGKVHDIVSMFSGGDPANDARIASLKQNYSDYQTAVNNYNQFAEKSGKSPITVDPGVSAAMDKIMALPGAQAKPDDQAVTDYLKKANARDTPANRKWAQEQMSAK